jgi:hypothetical protein
MVWIFDNLLYVYLYIFIEIIFYSVVYPASGPAITFTSVFKIIGQDLYDCTRAIWISTKQGLLQIFGCTLRKKVSYETLFLC